jgi:hypothetical protein
MGLLPNSPVFHREHTPGTMKPQHRNKKLNDPAARTAPEIPSHIRHASVAADILAGSEISFRDQIVENVCFKDRSFKSAMFEACLLNEWTLPAAA